MNITLRRSKPSDFPFLKEMLYEAVFWRDHPGKPSFEESLEFPEMIKGIAGWEEHDGDVTVVATINAVPVGAAWYRYWTNYNHIYGYIDESTPVLGVHADYRHQGIGTRMMEWLIEHASQHGIERISLNVGKDNHALNLYLQQGFQEYADKGDALTLVRNIEKSE